MPTLEQKVDSLAAYANNEMPKRIVTNDNPATVASGEIPVYTGAGLMTQKKTPAQLGLAASTDITTINTTLTNKADLVGGVVPSAQLPSYVDDVLEHANLALFPVTGESGKVYVALDTNKTYRWSGSTYIQIGSDLALGETLATAYRGDRGKTAYDHSQATGNPHGATTANINDSTDKRYVTDAQHTRVNTAASSSNDGYLTSTDWNTFNGKQNALADVITANSYGNNTQYPVVTVNAKGIVTGITLQTVPVPTLTDDTFIVQKNGSPAITAKWVLTALTGSVTHTYPNKNINFGDLSFVATTNSNTLSGTSTNCHIMGGSNNTVSGTDNIVVGGNGSNQVSGNRNTLVGCMNVIVNGADCLVSNSKNVSLTGNNLTVSGVMLSSAKSLTFPLGSVIVGSNSNEGCNLAVKSTFTLLKPDSGSVVVQDSSNIKPYVAMTYYGAFQDVAYHKITVMGMLTANNYKVFVVAARKNTSITTTVIEAGGNYINLTAVDDGAGRLTLTLSTTYTNQDTLTVFVDSFYGNLW